MRTPTFTETFTFETCTPGEVPDVDAYLAALDAYGERLRRASRLADFTRANGQIERRWVGSWRTDPTAVRVLVTPPPWSQS